MVNGKRKREFLKLDDTRENRKAAEISRKEIEFELATGIHKERLKRLDANTKTIEDGFKEFIKTKRSLKKSTIVHYQNAIDKLIKYSGNIKIKDFNKDKIDEIILCMQEEIIGNENKARRISSNTIASYFTKLKVLFEYFKERGYCETNPITTQHMKPKKIVVLNDKEIETILKKIKIADKEYRTESSLQHYRFIAMLVMTGLRVSECLNLSFDDINFRDNLIRVRNEKTDRLITFLYILTCGNSYCMNGR
jgi:site-specific recombinase XerD